MSRPAQLDRLPPQAFFVVSAGFHYLGPALAVLLFARVDVLGVAWLRIASAALVLAAWRRPCALFMAYVIRHRPRDGRRGDPPGKKVRQPWTMYG